MKTTILLLLLVYYIFCDDGILSKFHQTGFKIRDVRTELSSFSEKYYYFFEVTTTKYNRTTPVINMSLKMKINVKDKIELVVQGYKLLSNEYRHFPLRFQVNLKKAFDANMVGLQRMKNCGNITNFVFEKDVTYYACNFIIDETRFPPFIPNGKYKADLKFMYLNEEIMSFYTFGEIYTQIEYPKN